MIRSFDPEVMKLVGDRYGKALIGVDPVTWLANEKNIMLVENDDIGIATFEYPGVYTVHWFYEKAKGREAIKLARRMCHWMFEHDAKTLRGVTPVTIKAARWAARQVGMKSYGTITYPDGEENEILIMTKDEFNGRN